MIYAAIVGVSYALGYYRESQARALKAAQLETRLVEARLKTLQARAPSALPVQHAPRDLDARAPRSGGRRSDDQPPERSAAHHVRPERRADVRSRKRSSSSQKYLDIEQTRFQDRLAVRVRRRCRDARRRSPATDPAAARRERDQARHRAAHRSGVICRSRRDATATRCGSKCATTAAACSGATLQEAAHGRRPVEHARASRVPLRRGASPRVHRPARRPRRADAHSLSARRSAVRRRPPSAWHELTMAMTSTRVLIVDDEPLARERLRTLLADEPDIEVVGECATTVARRSPRSQR